MFKRTKVCAGVFAALGGAVLATSTPVAAQTAPAAAPATERIEITGSRIRSIGAVSSSPITSVSAETFNLSQPLSAEEVVRSLSASYPGINAGTNNGSNGTASVDLRGLGTNRTLVLINGRRVVPATLGGVVDTNAIPLSLVERIDVITGGASAVYGADAVSGVVNFVMKRNFTGIEAGTTYGVSESGDAKRRSSYATLGANLADGRGNVALNIGTSRTDPLTQGERDFGVFQLNSRTGARDGSNTSVPVQFLNVPGLGGFRVYDPSAPQVLRPAVAADNYNFNPPNYYVTPQDRTQISGLARFTINDNAEAYAEVINTKNLVTLNLAESGSFTNTLSIPIGNPFIPEPLRQAFCTQYNISAANCVAGNSTPISIVAARRFVEFGPRVNTFDNNTQQWTLGVRGALPFFDTWSYDGYLQKGTSAQTSARINWGSLSRLRQAVNATTTTRCVDTSNGCVPINLFGAAGSITPQMLAFINIPAIQTTSVEQRVANVSVSGELGMVKSPFARAPLSLALGAEQREIIAGNRSDGPSQVGGEILGTGAPLPDRRGSIKLAEGFVEANVPLAAGMPGIESMGLELGYRGTNFKTEVTSQSYGSWKAGLDWSPVKGLRFRAMQQRATRAPNVNELYAPVVTGLSNLGDDPCARAPRNAQGQPVRPDLNPANINTPGTIEALCVATGVPASAIGPNGLSQPSAGQINTTSGGNPALNPEEADTTTIGLVWEPVFVPGLSLSFDYFKIDIQKAVSSATTLQVFNGCYTSALNPGLSASAPFCGFIRRDTTNGGLNSGQGVITQSSNLGTVLTEGYDLEARYRFSVKDLGRFDVALTASIVDKVDFKTLPTVATINCAGYYGLNCGNPYAKTKFTQSTKWDMGRWSVGYQWRHIGKLDVEPTTGAWFADYTSIKAFDYIDLNGHFDVTKNLRLSLSINNLFDKKPPVVGNTIAGTGPNSGNTFPSFYDVVGRYYTMTARLSF